MPFYDYVCTQCGRRIEVIHGIHAEGPTTCEVCGGALKKAMSSPAIVYRGSGWAKKERSTAARTASAKKDGEPSSTASDGGKDTSSGTDASSGNDGSSSKGSSGKDGSSGKGSSGGEASTSGTADAAPSSSAPSSSASSGT
jgi:putative FmdB family regulatory protein